MLLRLLKFILVAVGMLHLFHCYVIHIAMLQCIVSQKHSGGLSGLVVLLISYALTLDPEASPKVRMFIDHIWRKSHQCCGNEETECHALHRGFANIQK